MGSNISINNLKPSNKVLDLLFQDESGPKITSESAQKKSDTLSAVLEQYLPNSHYAPGQNTSDGTQGLDQIEEYISDYDIDNATGMEGLDDHQFALPPPVKTSLEVPEGYKEVIQYWSTAELMTFQFELALKTRWQSIGTKVLLDAISIVKGVGGIIGGLWDISGLGGIVDNIQRTGTTASSGELAFAPNGWIIPVLGYTGAMPKADTDGGFDINRRTRAADNGTGGKHAGVDLFGERGTPIVAVTDGLVTGCSRDGYNKNGSKAYGGLFVQYGDTTSTYSIYCCHFDSVAPGIDVGSQLTAGQIIGYMGNSGNASGGPVHLHFGVKVKGEWANPEEILRNAVTKDGATAATANASTATNSSANTSSNASRNLLE